MSEEKWSQVDVHEDFLQHVEDGASKMKLLSWTTIVVAGLLVLSYFYELVLPLTGTTSVTVSLSDPILIVTEVLVLVLALAWLYVGVTNLRFTVGLSRRIAEARAAEAEMEKKLVAS